MDTKLKKWKGVISFICISLCLVIAVGVITALAVVVRSLSHSALMTQREFAQVEKFLFSNNYINSPYVNFMLENLITDGLTYAESKTESVYLKDFAADKNGFIEIKRAGTTILKSKNTEIASNGLKTVLPEGYSTAFYFSSGKMEIIKDGQTYDIYEDNVYEYEKGDISIPGYSNNPIEPIHLNTEIFITLKDQPINYQNTNLKDYSYTYVAKENFTFFKFIINLFIFTASSFIILLFIGILFYRHKRLVNMWIAKLTNFIPLEVKLIAAAFIFNIFVISYNGRVSSEVFFILLPISFVLIWLFLNDRKYNKPLYKRSIVYYIYNLIAQPNINIGLYRKLIRLIIIISISIAFAVPLSIMLFGFLTYSDLRRAILCGGLSAAFYATFFFSVAEVYKICKNTSTFFEYLQNLSKGEKLEISLFNGSPEIENAIIQLTELEDSLQATLLKNMQAERLKIELITNVSHDIKTPLTSVISYVDLLKGETELPKHVIEYINILDEKSQRLKNMVQDIFEVSKAASGQLTINETRLDLARLLRQTLADMSDSIADSGLIICEDIDSACEIMADGDRMYRVYQNLIANALKYSMPNSRIYIVLEIKDQKALVSIKNVSASPLDNSVDFTQRFVRGDESRTDGSSGLGLSIAGSFTSACGGKFYVETNADLFSAYTEFDICD